MTFRTPRSLTAVVLGGALAMSLVVSVSACGNPPRKPNPTDTPPPRLAATFDLQAHRGGAALTTENTVEAFGRALDIGVTTLELDAQVTKDHVVVIAHDPRLNTDACRDAALPAPLDDMHPYVGKPFSVLTWGQVSTVDCAVAPAAAFPDQKVADDGRLARLDDVFALLRDRKADTVNLNLELKTEADNLGVTLPREEYITAVWDVVTRAGMADHVTIQSFDWTSLKLLHQIAPAAKLVALTSPPRLEVGQDGASPWLGGLDIDAFGGDPVAAAATIDGVVTISPRDDLVDGPFVARAHAATLLVVPWTVDEAPEMKDLIRLGVDGLITNRPDILRSVMSDSDLPQPKAYPAG